MEQIELFKMLWGPY